MPADIKSQLAVSSCRKRKTDMETDMEKIGVCSKTVASQINIMQPYQLPVHPG